MLSQAGVHLCRPQRLWVLQWLSLGLLWLWLVEPQREQLWRSQVRLRQHKRWGLVWVRW